MAIEDYKNKTFAENRNFLKMARRNLEYSDIENTAVEDGYADFSADRYTNLCEIEIGVAKYLESLITRLLRVKRDL